MKLHADTPITSHITKFGKVVLPTNTSLHVRTNLDRNLPMPQFCYYMAGNLDNILAIKSVTALKLYHILIHSLASNKELGSTVTITSDTLSKKLNIDLPSVSRALKILIDNGLIVSKNRKSIKLSPKYAWRGNLSSWQVEVDELNLQEYMKETEANVQTNT
jgi:predicted transcriptional regulator